MKNQPKNRLDYLASKWKCKCGKTHTVPVREVYIKEEVLNKLPLFLKENSFTDKIIIISDTNTYNAAGRQISCLLKDNNIKFQELIIEKNNIIADDITAKRVLSQINDAKILISCGSGTITDLTRYSAFHKKIPFIAVATAASMNGYASSIVALTCNGLKKTIPVNPAIAVFADLNILAKAPIEMTRSGLGDVISKPVCNADWKLSSIVKKEDFCDIPFEIIKDLESIYINNSTLLKKNDKKIIAALAEALIFSGISMVIAGSSSPASGAEHLISHTIDMQSALKHKKHDFHGTQVGVATIISSKLYEYVLDFDPNDINWENLREHHNKDKYIDIKNYWARFSDEVLKEFSKKQMKWDEKKQELESIFIQWEEIKNSLKKYLMGSSKITKVLQDAEAKTNFREIGLNETECRKVVSMALTMRSRYTILDLADDLNLLDSFIETITND